MKMKPETLEFIKFFNSQGIKFVDAETGEEIIPDEEEGTYSLGAVNSSSDNGDGGCENIIRVVRGVSGGRREDEENDK